MKFRDDKVIRRYGYKFERARLVQGTIIHVVLIALLVAGALDGITTAIVTLALGPVVYIVLLGYYFHKLRAVRKALVIATLRMITLPSSLVG